MTETMDAVQAAVNPEDQFGRIVSKDALRLLGRQFPEIGFGEDLPTSIEGTLLPVLARRLGPEPILVQLVGRIRRSARWQMTWESNVRTALEYSILSVDQSFLTMVEPHVGSLRPRYVADDLTLDHIGYRESAPDEVPVYDLPLVLRWRHYPFAHGLWYDRVIHLRTRELLDFDAVYARLLLLFQRYCSSFLRQTFASLPEDAQVAELRDFHLAIYERTVALLAEARLQPTRYQRSISQRRADSPSSDLHLTYPLDHSDGRTERFNLDTAWQIRTESYHALLERMLQRCAFALNRS